MAALKILYRVPLEQEKECQERHKQILLGEKQLLERGRAGMTSRCPWKGKECWGWKLPLQPPKVCKKLRLDSNTGHPRTRVPLLAEKVTQAPGRGLPHPPSLPAMHRQTRCTSAPVGLTR